MDDKPIARQTLLSFYRNNQYGWVGSLVLFSTLALVMRSFERDHFWLYPLLLIPHIVIHILNHQAFTRQVERQAIDLSRWQNRAAIISAYIGLLIGSLPVTSLDLHDPGKTYLVSTILIMSMFGSSVIAGGCPRVHLAWSATSILPVTLLLLTTNTNDYQVLGWMILLLGLPVGVALNRYNNRILNASFKLRFENLALMKTVEAEKNRAEKASAAKTRFLAASSHDLRQPLHALNLFLGALANTRTDTEQRRLLDKAIRCGHALDDLMNALLDISRLEAGNVTTRVETLDLDSLLETLLDENRPLFGEQDIQLDIDTTGGWQVRSDRILLGRMLRNLLRNILDHSQASHADITCEEKNGKLHLLVRDNGCGIPDNETQHVFSDFYQINNPERDRNKGLGLGLAIVKRLADLLRHEIRLHSRAGAGCCFEIILPQAPRAAISGPATGHSPVDISGLFLIVIDDDRNVLEAMKTLLKQHGCELLCGESSDEIEGMLQADAYPPPDLMLIDYRLRENRNGVEAARHLQNHFGRDIPVIIVTAETEQATSEHIARAGFQKLGKPVAADNLLQSIQATIQATIDGQSRNH